MGDLKKKKQNIAYAFCGANDTKKSGDIAGKTVVQVRKDFAQILNIPKGADPLLGKVKVKESYVIKAGEAIEFKKDSGRKG